MLKLTQGDLVAAAGSVEDYKNLAHHKPNNKENQDYRPLIMVKELKLSTFGNHFRQRDKYTGKAVADKQHHKYAEQKNAHEPISVIQKVLNKAIVAIGQQHHAQQ